MNIRSVFALSCLLILSACLGMGAQTPAPVSTYGVSSGAGSAGVHSVVAGDTLYTIAQSYHLPMRDIVHINNLQAPFKFKTGQRIKLPPPQEYQAQNGDTVYSVSLLFGVNSSEIARLNNLKAPYSLHQGQVLRLPSVTRKTQLYKRPASAPIVMVESEVLVPPQALQAQNHQMQTLETQTLQKEDSDEIDNEPMAQSTQKKPNSNAWAFDPPPQNGESKGLMSKQNDVTTPPKSFIKPQSENALFVQKEKPSFTNNQKPLKLVNNVPRRESSKFLRPVNGDVIDSFGVKNDGTYNDGINIKASKGTPVFAAENGVVVYAGNELKGSGNLILLRHEEQWITAYAHMSDMDVKKGDIVRRGQTIGEVGSTGSVSSPQLHFEIRRGLETLNPKNYME